MCVILLLPFVLLSGLGNRPSLVSLSFFISSILRVLAVRCYGFGVVVGSQTSKKSGVNICNFSAIMLEG